MRLESLHVKNQTPDEPGLPKIATSQVRVNKMGCEGDYNRYRATRKKNTPDRAVLIMTVDMIEQLRHEGWPIEYGDLGENMTLSGIEYGSIKPGDRFELGEVLLEVSEKCNPCHNLGFLDYVEDVNGFIKTMKNRRGWYARVLSEGIVNHGDLVRRV